MNKEDLHRYFNGAASRPFRFGHFDCVRFVVESLYIGWDKDYRDKMDYWDRRSAVRRLRQSGGLLNACIDAFGEPCDSRDMHTGCVAYIHSPRPTLALVMPEYLAVKRGAEICRLEFDFDYGFIP